MPAPATRIVNVRILLFASYADRLGLESLRAALPALATVGDALEHVRSLPGGDQIPPRPLCAVNLSHADLDTPLTEGDEVALLPPLAGG
ncbi:MAG TPA: MoaD/ThiS family protein [Gemmatimonadales bacterium]|nr:MoaD/ThiS family protein [Gemmatimonadales bacterium]